MCAVVLPERLAEVRARLRPLGPAGRGHRPGHRRRRHRDRRRAGSPPPAGPARPPARSPGSPPRAHLRRDRPRPARPRRRPTAARPGSRPGRWSPATACPSAGWTPAPSCWPSSAWPNLASRRWVTTSTTPRSRRTRSPVRARRGRPAGQGHDQGPCRLDRRQPVGRRDRSVARGGAERRGGDPQRRDHRRAEQYDESSTRSSIRGARPIQLHPKYCWC